MLKLLFIFLVVYILIAILKRAIRFAFSIKSGQSFTARGGGGNRMGGNRKGTRAGGWKYKASWTSSKEKRNTTKEKDISNEAIILEEKRLNDLDNK